MASVADYTAQLAVLLPTGLAWSCAPGSAMRQLLAALAAELARVDARAWDLVEEADPRATHECLPDWERVCGLPDACTPPGTGTLQQRRGAVVAKVTGRGGQSRQYYIDLAASLGYEVTVTEYRPFRAGLSAAGDPLTNGLWIWYWRVGAPEVTTTSFRGGVSAAGEPLRTWGNEILECAIRRTAPAHTNPLFTYGG